MPVKFSPPFRPRSAKYCRIPGIDVDYSKKDYGKTRTRIQVFAHHFVYGDQRRSFYAINQARNSITSKRNQVFSTAADNQKSVEINILLGERPLAKHNISIGKFLLENITPAKSGIPQIRVTFEVDTSFDVKVEAIEVKTGAKVESRLIKPQIEITDSLINKLISDAHINKIRDDAELIIAEAELRVQKDQSDNMFTSTTKKMEQLISDLGIAIMNDSPHVAAKTKELRNLLESSNAVSSPFGGGGFDSLFEGFSPSPFVKQKRPLPKRVVSNSENQKPKDTTTPTSIPLTHITALIQNFLEQISPDLETKRVGACKH